MRRESQPTQNLDPRPVERFDSQHSQPKTTKAASSMGFKDIVNKLEKKGRKTSQVKLRFKTVREEGAPKSRSAFGLGSAPSQPKISGKVLKLGTASKSALQRVCETRKASCVSQG